MPQEQAHWGLGLTCVNEEAGRHRKSEGVPGEVPCLNLLLWVFFVFNWKMHFIIPHIQIKTQTFQRLRRIK
jgi:hypothetical protein